MHCSVCDDLRVSLTALIAIIRRTGGFMRHEDQSALFTAEAAVLAYNASQADPRQSAQDPAASAPGADGEIVEGVVRFRYELLLLQIARLAALTDGRLLTSRAGQPGLPQELGERDSG